MNEPPVCECHGEAMKWQKEARKKHGGYWRCSVRANESDRDRYHNDSLFRIRKQIRDNARRRTLSVEQQRNRLKEMRGSL